MNKKAFTFIEMLVVLSLVAVLTAIGIVSYRSTSAGARDNRRRTDLEIIRSALELYKADNGSYPLTADGYDLAADYFSADPPADPSDSTLSYDYNSDGLIYCVRACLEQGSSSGTCPTAFSDCADGNSYILKNP